MGVEITVKLKTHTHSMKFTTCLLLGLLALSQANPVPQMDEECDDLDAQAAIAEPLDEMRFFPEMIEAEQELQEEDDCEEVEEPLEVPQDLHYAAASMAGQNEMDYLVNDECDEENVDECEGDEEVEQEFRGDYETEDLGILENAEFAQVDQSAVKLLDGETDAAEIEECEEEY